MNRPVFVLASLLSLTALANASGAIGYSGAPSTGSCNDCHSGGTAPSVTITGPDSLAAGATGNYTVVVNGGARVGVNIAITDPLGALNPISSNLGLAFRELYQATPQNSGTSFQFSLSAPPNSGTLTIYATGNAVNNNGATSGDRSANVTKAVTIMPGTGALPPTITMPAAAMQSPLRAKATQVSISAADDGPQGTLTYTWSATGPGAVVFSPNSNNAAATSTATFSRAGSYMITCTVRDSVNQTVQSTFALTVESNFTALKMTPYAVRLMTNATQEFTSVAVDQFGAPVTPQPTILYGIVGFGGGVFGTSCTSMCTSNVFKAQSTSGGPFAVESRAMGIATSATIAVGTTMLPASGDTTPPTASLVEPASGTALMTGTVFEAIANDPPPNPSGISKVEFTIAEITVATANASPWRATYTAQAGIPGGKQPLVAVAYDLAGNPGKSSSVIVDVPMVQGGGAGGSGGSTGGGTGGSAGGSATGGGGMDPGGCACGTTNETALAGILALLALALTRRKRVPSPLAGREPG